MPDPFHRVRLYRGFVERGLAGKALFERSDNGFGFRSVRTLDHKNVAGPDGSDHLRFEAGRAIGIAAPFAGGKTVPEMMHQRTTTKYQVDMIGLDGVIQAGMQF